MTRKGPKRAGDRTHKTPTTERLIELAETVIQQDFVLGPLDQEDLREALCEVIHRRNFERFHQQTNLEPKEAAA